VLTELRAQSYSLPLSNRADIKIVADDTDIDANSDGTPDQAPYSGMSITYLPGVGFTAWANATVYSANYVVSSAGRWFYTVAGGTSNGTAPGNDTGVTWVAYTGERLIENTTTYAPFTVIVDGNAGSKVEIHEFCQFQLRQSLDIDAGSGNRKGEVADQLTGWVGDRLTTTTGVYIDDWTPVDINNITNEITYKDATGADRTPNNPDFIAQGSIIFNTVLQNDDDSYYWMYFASTPGGDWGTTSAILVEDVNGDPIQDFVLGRTSASFDFDYDNNAQGSRTPGTDADVVVVALGTDGAQYVIGQGTIGRSITNTVRLEAGLERNYLNP